MKESNIYILLWQKYRPVILQKMRLSLTEPQEYQLSKHEFEAVGVRLTAGYSFSLDLNKGKLLNNIEGSAVARDLLEVLRKSPTAKELMMTNSFKIKLAKDCKLTIQSIQPVV